MNSDAEFFDLTGWKTAFGGELDIIEGSADEGLYSFKHSNRNFYYSGPEQVIPTKCLRQGVNYVFTAKIKLEDEEDAPFYCSKEAEWRSDNFCVVLSIEMKGLTNTKVVSLSNEDERYVSSNFEAKRL